MEDSVDLKLTINVTYGRDAEDGTVDPDECRQVLEELVQFAVNRGLLSGDRPDLYVENYNYTISGLE